ncbi:helix-turn-helix domain-containing protein [Thalassospira sp. MCCC 1A01428]|uniref:AlbA family DNA-binding domain-containing protein n=1 Tax=Thalassospira sp. MCCC 1A01428 TaxID=1470575 RepID=UPI000A1E94B0|nr:ATP-binding protein [Thalassospira sp. MCCC 1A01428]OSQ44769.1 hypothetical protein THS27_06295 [Thalassospira sp. MCCC 1A01428]
MAKRNTLTDFEVGIIKSLLINHDFSNQKISGLINRSRGDASKDISTGRISNIKNNQIAKYVPIPAASLQTTEEFLRNTIHLNNEPDPLSELKLATLIPTKKENPEQLDIKETNIIECKEGFNLPMKTIAAFANNKGGYILLGVKDKTWEIKGISDRKLSDFDYNKWNQRVISTLGIEIEFSHKVLQYADKKIAIFHISEAHTKPVIFSKNIDDAHEGHIYYRYAGEDRLITPLDLQNIIDERVRKSSQTTLSKHLANILRIGIENSAIMDLKTGTVEGKSGNFYLDEKLLPQISFIKEGEFKETSGKPTLKLIGEVKNMETIEKKITEDTLKMYPFSWTDLSNEVHKKFPEIKNKDLNKKISETRIKHDKRYSTYIFINKKSEQKYKETGILPKSITSVYNNDALELLIKEFELEKKDP